MTAVVVFALSAGLVAWVYAGYPLALMLLGRLRPRPRLREPREPALSVIVAAHDEEAVIADKVANVRASDYPAGRLELVVASDGSQDRTVELARAAGATHVLDLPRHGQADRPQPGRGGGVGRAARVHRRRLALQARHAAPSSRRTSPTSAWAAWRPTWCAA